MRLMFSPEAWAEYLEWQASDRKALKKIKDLIASVQRTPTEGPGKPEPLKHSLAGMWSRRIDGKNRLVYCVQDDVCMIVQCRGHYADR